MGDGDAGGGVGEGGEVMRSFYEAGCGCCGEGRTRNEDMPGNVDGPAVVPQHDGEWSEARRTAGAWTKFEKGAAYRVVRRGATLDWSVPASGGWEQRSVDLPAGAEVEYLGSWKGRGEDEVASDVFRWRGNKGVFHPNYWGRVDAGWLEPAGATASGREARIAGMVVGYRKDPSAVLEEVRRRRRDVVALEVEMRSLKDGIRGFDPDVDAAMDDVMEALASAKAGMAKAVGVGQSLAMDRDLGFLSSER